METKIIVEARKQAEKAVVDMPEGDLKLRAFEVILQKLLDERAGAQPPIPSAVTPKARLAAEKVAGLQGRIFELSSGKFFSAPRTVPEVRCALEEAGFHYKYSDVAVGLLRLTRKKALRRIPYTSEEGKNAYRYCLP